MGIFSRLAELLDTQVRVDRATIKSLQGALDEMTAKVIQTQAEAGRALRYRDDIIKTAANAGIELTKLKQHRKKLRDQLFVARAYAMDVYDELTAELEKYGPKKRGRQPARRVELEATLASVKLDLKEIADTLAETSETGAGAAEPVKVAA